MSYVNNILASEIRGSHGGENVGVVVLAGVVLCVDSYVDSSVG
jgi:hypothetical protein